MSEKAAALPPKISERDADTVNMKADYTAVRRGRGGSDVKVKRGRGHSEWVPLSCHAGFLLHPKTLARKEPDPVNFGVGAH